MTPNLKMMTAVVVTALALTACSDDGSGTTTAPSVTTTTTAPSTTPPTTAVSGDFVFGFGELPDSIPEDFPIPNGSQVDSTLVNTKTGFTEAALVVPAETDVVAQFFEQNLEARGYDFDPPVESAGGRWIVTFGKGDLTGTIDIAPASAGVSRAVVTLPGDV